MERSLVALAALGAFATGASAQSSVTLFGVVDLSVRCVNNDDATWQLAQDGMSSSRLGFRGVEDLGGGLKASFWLEGALGPDTGTGTSTFGNGNAGGNFFQFRRRSTLSLSNEWGELRLGRDFTPTFWNIGGFDPFGVVGLGNAGNLFLGAELRSVTSAGDAFGTLVRANNTVGYILPNGQFGPGLYGQLMVAAGEGAPLNKYYGGRIGYASGPFDVAAAYGWTAVDAADTLSMTNWNVGGSWSFGPFGKVSAFYGQLEIDVPIGGKVDQKNWYIGYVVPFGQWNFKASYGGVSQGGNPTATTTFDGNDASQWALGVDYNLSKRTAIYGTVSAINNASPSGNRVGTAYSVSGTGSALSRGTNSTGGEVGIKHSF